MKTVSLRSGIPLIPLWPNQHPMRGQIASWQNDTCQVICMHDEFSIWRKERLRNRNFRFQPKSKRRRNEDYKNVSSQYTNGAIAVRG